MADSDTKTVSAPPYPKVGDTWRSRDKRDEGLTVRVQAVDEYQALVYIKRRSRHTRVALRRWTRDYEFVSRSARGCVGSTAKEEA